MSWPLGLAAVIVSLTALARTWRGRAEPPQNAGASKPGPTVAICVALLLGSTFLNLMVLGVTRDSSKSAISAIHLRSLGHSLDLYAEEYEAYPPLLDVFTTHDLMTRKMLLSPFDPDADGDIWGNKLTYSSYAYMPGLGKPVSDADLIIAFERSAFVICEPRLRALKERWVLFGDGQVRHLTDDEFAEAMRKDKERRQKLGWTTATQPTTASSSQPKLRP
ncbi:MAG: hypothetical protein JXA69_01275 [Phycisphaerae bacterium]|nr:hypothetical protein [Phycisphaerae bacterium]